MPQVATNDCLYTTVKNTSGARRAFSFLGQHGTTLDDDESVSIPGDLVATLGSQDDGRRFKALERSLLAGDLVIISTPAPILYDAVDNASRMLAISNGVLGYVDPCWNESGDSDFVEYDGG